MSDEQMALMKSRGWRPSEILQAGDVVSEIEVVKDGALGRVYMTASVELDTMQAVIEGDGPWGQETVTYRVPNYKYLPTPREAVTALDWMYREYEPRS